jgi:hypothetical protein
MSSLAINASETATYRPEPRLVGAAAGRMFVAARANAALNTSRTQVLT